MNWIQTQNQIAAGGLVVIKCTLFYKKYTSGE